MTQAVALAQQASTGVSQGFKNRIINGAMTIDQRNAGASVTISNTAANTYTLDRWYAYGNVASKFSVQQDAGTVTPPAGFTDYFGVTSLAATTVGAGDQYIIGQPIEGFNVADLNWGTANAKTVTLSFWVRSSLTGTFGGVFQNSAANRNYPFSFTISSANTWEQKSITVAGDTTGTWLGTNGVGIRLIFSLGTGSTYSATAGVWTGSSFITSSTGATSVVGTNGATFYITGVQLEVGSTATSFDYLDYGRSLIQCQRYYEKSYAVETALGTGLASGWFGFVTSSTGTEVTPQLTFRTTKRSAPVMTVYNAVSGASGAVYRTSDAASISLSLDRIGTNSVGNGFLGSGSTNIYYYHWAASAEL
jgi:hypothetical protein